jgi:hypothetical protein
MPTTGKKKTTRHQSNFESVERFDLATSTKTASEPSVSKATRERQRNQVGDTDRTKDDDIDDEDN